MASPLSIDLKAASLDQCFDVLDSAPLSSRDLDPRVVRYILESIDSEPGRRTPDIHLRIHLPEVRSGDSERLAAAVRDHWAREVASERLQLQRVLRLGRTSFVIGILFLMAIFSLSEAIQNLSQSHFIESIGESLLIFGWVAMWRPAELLLYDWWPVLERLRIYRKLAEARVEIVVDPAQ